MQKVLKNIIWGCLVIIPFITLYVANGQGLDIFNTGSGLFFPFIAGKNFAFRILVEIAFTSWVLLALRDPKYRPKKSLLFGAYAVFMFIILIADIFGVDQTASFLSNFERMEGFVAHIHLFAYFIVLISFLHTLPDWHKLFKVFLASNVVVVGYGFLQALGVKQFLFAKLFPVLSAKIAEKFPVNTAPTRIDATLGNSAYYAIYCLFFAFISALLYSYAKTRGEKTTYVIIGFLNLISLFYSGTRGTMIGILVGAIVTLIIIAYKEKGHLRKVVGGSLVVLIIFVSTVFMFKDSSFVKNTPSLERFSSISISDLTTMSRITVWKMSYEGWLKHPILGYGQENFSYIFPRFFDAKNMWNVEPWYDRSHDVFFDWLVAGGALGLLSYLSLFFVALYMMWKKDSRINLREKAILTGVLVGYFIHNIFVFDNLISYILFFTVLAYISFHSHTDDKIMLGKKNFGEAVMIFDPLVVVLFVLVMYYANYLPYRVNTLLLKAIDINRLVQTNSFDKALEIQKKSFEEAINLNTIGKQEVIEQMFQNTGNMIQMIQNKMPDSLPKEQKDATIKSGRELLVFTKETAEKMKVEFANNVRVLNIMGMFYNSIGDVDNAQFVLSRAVEFSPNKQLLLFDLVRTYLIAGNYNDAYTLALRAYLLAPNYSEAKRFYVISGIYANKISEVKTVLASNGQVMIPDKDVISTMVSTGKKQEAINLLGEYKKANSQMSAEIDTLINQVIAMPSK